MSDPPKGIANLGNTCYFNACIQVLSQTEPLNNLVRDKQEVENQTKAEKNIFMNWKDITQILHNHSDQNGLLQPRGFLNSVQTICPTLFKENEPNDISEFLLFFIQALHTCFSRSKKVLYTGTVYNDVDNIAIECYKLLTKTYELEYSEIMDIFQGIYVSRIVSKTNITQSTTPELFFILDLSIPSSPENKTIYDCFNHFIAPETLEGENAWFNEKTGQKEDIQKMFSFWSFPKILVICLKRFSYDGVSKESCMVSFPHILDLRSYIYGYRASEYMYDLYGVCNHLGNVSGGHYTSFVKKAEKWYHCDDETIQLVEEPNMVITKFAYCLFYVKK